jgi:SNF2 family DNA or RNA helicase
MREDESIFKESVDMRINLKTHQLQLLRSMIKLEDEEISLNDNESLKTEMGILSNKVGSGKSFCMLALISHKKRLVKQAFVKHKFGRSIVVMDKRNDTNIAGGNLIVSPHHLIKPVWEKYITEYTNLSYVTICKKSYPLDWESLSKYDIVICNYKLHNKFVTACPWTWSRVIYDEADTISIPACVTPRYRFVWFITSSLRNLLFPGGYYSFVPAINSSRYIGQVNNFTEGLSHNGFIKDTFKSLDSHSTTQYLKRVILKQSDDYVKRMLDIPDNIEHLHRCKCPFYINVLNGVMGSDFINMLNAGNYEGAIERIGCTVDTKDNIINLVCKDLSEKHENLNMKLQYLNSLNVRDCDRESHSNKIKKTEETMASIEQRITIIKTKINDIDSEQLSENCPICFDDLKKESCILKCCMNVFCMKCIGTLIARETYKCPMCRHQYTSEDILHVNENVEKSKTVVDTMTKNETLLKLIKDNPTSKFLIFSSYDQSFCGICETLRTNNILYAKIVGNQNTINNNLEKYINNDTNVLMLNSSHYGCGLNLTNTTDLVFFHKMPIEMKTQVIGRAQRLGRTDPLNVHYLFHENEINS